MITSRRNFIKLFGASAVALTLPPALITPAPEVINLMPPPTYAETMRASEYILQTVRKNIVEHIGMVKEWMATQHVETMELRTPDIRQPLRHVPLGHRVDIVTRLILPNPDGFTRILDRDIELFRIVGDEYMIEFVPSLYHAEWCKFDDQPPHVLADFSAQTSQTTFTRSIPT